jgi:hypothetical protein
LWIADLINIADFGFVISDIKSAIDNRAVGELGEANPQSEMNIIALTLHQVCINNDKYESHQLH